MIDLGAWVSEEYRVPGEDAAIVDEDEIPDPR
jgi:endogenous inhibitor of DNA gyrase (YacG/DUF329 family)